MNDVGGFPTRILIVDDSKRIRDSLAARIRLSSERYLVETTASGQDAMARLDTATFDVVLCDLRLRGEMDGIAVTRKIREEYPEVRVVVFSGKDEGESKIDVLHAGAYSYLSKPINHDELLHAIRTINSIRRTEKLSQWFQTLVRISYDLQASFDFDRLANRIVDGVVELGYTRSRLYLFDGDRQMVVGKLARGLPEDVRFEQYEIPFQASPMIARIFKSDRPTFWNKSTIMEQFGEDCAEPWISELGLGEITWIDCPMLVRNKRIGTIAADNLGRPDYQYTEEDRQIMGLLAGMAAHALNNSRMYQKEALANASLRSILRDAPDTVITTDLDGTVNFVSPSSERVIGYSPAEMVGHRAAEFYTDANGAEGVGYDVAHSIMRQLRSEGTISNRMIHLRSSRGKPRATALSASLLTGERGREIGTLGFVKDLGPFKQQSWQYHDLLEGFGYGTLLLSPQGVIGFINRKAEHLLCRSRAQLQGKRLLDLVPSAQQAELEGGLRRVLDEGDAEVALDLALIRPEDQRLPIKATLTPVGMGGERSGVAVALYDKSELGALIQSGQLMALGQTAAGVAHEINNPLNNLLLAAREIADEIAGQELSRAGVEDCLGIIHRNGERIRHIVHQLREFARPSEFHRQPISLNGVIRDSVSFFATRFRNHNIKLIEDLEPDLPNIHGDATRLQQVLINLISNAEEAMRGQDEPKLVRVESRNEPPDRVCVTVSDTGSGIPEGIRDAVFDPFFTTKPPSQGTGLGLSISRSVIDLHEGSIGVEDSPDGRGTRFRIVLPCA